MFNRTHNCGGSLISALDHVFCNRCSAFTYNGADVPDGTDRFANQAAYDAGEDESPAASDVAYVCTNDRYTPTEDTFPTVADFRAMCHACFGVAPVLTPLDFGTKLVDETGVVVLRRVSV